MEPRVYFRREVVPQPQTAPLTRGMASLPPAGSRGAILVFLLFRLTNPGWCQISGVAGLCSDCKDLRTHLLPENMAYFAKDITQVTPCYSIIRFQLEKNVVCGKSDAEWVDKLKGCIETKEFLKCRRKAKKPTLAPAQVTTTSASTAPAPAVVLTTTKGSELTTHPMSTPKNPNLTEKDEYQIILEPKNDATNKTNNDSLAGGGLKNELKNSTPPPETDQMNQSTVAVLSLLAVVFVLVIAVTYLICRRKASKKKYEEVTQTPETESLQ